MSRNFHRRCTLSLQGGGSRTIQGGGPEDLEITFAIEISTVQSPNAAHFRIWNPNRDTIAAFQGNEFKTVQFQAGYEDNIGPVYSGDIKQTKAGKENPVDTYIDIFCFGNGAAYQQSRVGKTLAAGHTPMDRVSMALDAMKPFGVTGLGIVNVDLSQPQYPRGRAFVGMARDVMRAAALSAGARWTLRDGKVDIVDHRKPLQSNGAFVLNSQTGMVGIPEQTEDGIQVRSLINSALQVNGKVQIAQKDINLATQDYASVGAQTSQRNFNLQNTGVIAADGIYRVLFMRRIGDTRSEEWYDELTCIADSGASPNSSQLLSLGAR